MDAIATQIEREYRRSQTAADRAAYWEQIRAEDAEHWAGRHERAETERAARHAASLAKRDAQDAVWSANGSNVGDAIREAISANA